jgi:ATP-dependent Zn protease
MSDSVGMLNMAVLIGRHSADREIIDEAKKLSGRLYQEVLQFLKEHEPELKRIAQALLEKETLFDKDIDELLF